ncbi:hypothetical protein [Bacillus velezensis]|uniref:hypothetical protein n=1 Tax=Bacillus velezensis TaxID=492670 RepID=UPI00083E05D8|nr:hypothetical protein [Bacillus velezensis]ODB76045.1 hypothetical protein A7310_01910 [Bacillus velezensis]
MTETNASIHVLADETLGGIKREYVEVDRKAEVGEKIVIVNADVQCEEPYHNGYRFEVESLLGCSRGIQTACHRDIFDFEYHVLEPTNIVHIDGRRYEMIDRKAEVGERIIIVRPDECMGNAKEAGIVGTVGSLYSAGDVCVKDIGFVLGTEYRVLIPVEAAEDEPKPADPIDVIASLAQEVAELKRKVSDLETVVERHERINGRHNCEIDTLHKDNRTLGEELARLAAEAGKETEVGAKALAEAFVALRRAGL